MWYNSKRSTQFDHRVLSGNVFLQNHILPPPPIYILPHSPLFSLHPSSVISHQFSNDVSGAATNRKLAWIIERAKAQRERNEYRERKGTMMTTMATTSGWIILPCTACIRKTTPYSSCAKSFLLEKKNK